MNIKFIQTYKAKVAKKLGIKFAEAPTDRGLLQYTGDLVVGTDVYLVAPNGDLEPAPDGDYVHEDGRVIVVINGRVSEINGEANNNLDPDPLANVEGEVTEANVVDVVAEVVEIVSDIADEVINIERELEPYKKMSDEFKAMTSRIQKLEKDLAAATKANGKPVTTTTKKPEQFQKTGTQADRATAFMQWRNK